MNKKIKAIMITPGLPIRETMRKITGAALKGAPTGIALIVGKNYKLLGVVTDGDIRRALVNDIDIDSPIRKIMIKDPITVPTGLTETEMLNLVTDKVKASGRIRDVKVDQIITVDGKGRVDDVLNFFDLWRSADVKNKRVCVMGLGFVGLTLAVVLADVGFDVIGFDVKKEMVDDLNKGVTPFYEKGLSALLKFHTSRKKFRAISDLEKGVADIYILSVGTPLKKDRKPDLRFIKESARQTGKILKKRDLVILRSTVPVGTTRNVVQPILEKESGLKVGDGISLAYAPERTVEGKALEELRSLPQVIGGFNKRSLDTAANFFSNLNHTIVRVPSIEAAEMVKLVNNSSRDLSFAFANELALICDRWGLDAVSVINAANDGYPRNHISVPSPGVGGICLKKDPYIYINSAQEVGYEPNITLSAKRINEYMPEFVYRKVESFMKKHKKDHPVKVFIVGFAFKGEPETSDIRDSITIDLLQLIKKKSQWKLHGYDPVVKKGEIEKLGVAGCSLREGFKGADCVMVLNNHRSYADMDILGLLESMNKPALFLDGWHMFPHEEIEQVDGIIYGGLSGKN